MGKIDVNSDEITIVSKWSYLFKNAMVSKSEYTKKWQTYIDAYNGDYFKDDSLPDYRSNQVSNYIFSIVETIRPIMLDNDPKFQATARQSEGLAISNDVQEALLYEWDRDNVNEKLSRELINTLVLGNAVFFIPWDKHKKEVTAIPINPFNLFVDPLATCVDDADYIIYASYKNVNMLKRMFPSKADKLSGGQVNYSELVYKNDYNTRIDNQVLVLEIYDKGYEDTNDKEVNPNGYIYTICPEIGVLLDKKPNPYNGGGFPFVLLKDYDIPGKFWGEGEVSQLLSPQKHMNDLNNSVIDNAKTTANMPWIVDKNSGIGKGSITARPGLIIRKNPGSDVRRDTPPSMPLYVTNTVEVFKSDMEMISGVHNTLRGENSSGVYTAQGILALQEAGQVRVRLKVKILENALARMAQMWVSRIKQYWIDDRWVRISKPDGSYDLKKFTTSKLEHDYDIRVSSGSTMPVNRSSMLDLMIRLAQTQMPDGQPLVDREAVVQYLPEEIKATLMERMVSNQSSLTQIQQSIEELGKIIEELNQGLQQITQDSTANDEEIYGVIEELTKAVEDVNGKILQLQDEYDTMVKEEEEQKKQKQIEDKFYNKGFTDSEKLYKSSQDEMLPQQEENEDFSTSMPDDILQGIEGMSDEELQMLMQEQPNLMDLIK